MSSPHSGGSSLSKKCVTNAISRKRHTHIWWVVRGFLDPAPLPGAVLGLNPTSSRKIHQQPQEGASQ